MDSRFQQRLEHAHQQCLKEFKGLTTAQSPEIIYKYREWNNSKHQEILTGGALYFPSAQSFDDVLDCRPPERFPETEEEKYEAVKNTIEHLMSNPHFKGIQIDKSFDFKIDSPLYDQEKFKAITNDVLGDFLSKCGVLSMTPDCQNKRMWENYGDNYHGFCLGFKVTALQNAMAPMFPVIYVDELPPIDEFNEKNEIYMIKRFFLKLMEWSFEKEFRLIKLFGKKVTAEERNIKFPPESLVEIILGKDMPQEHKEAIRFIAQQKYPNAKIIELSEN